MTDEHETYELDPTAPPVPRALDVASTPAAETNAPVEEPAPRAEPTSETVAAPKAAPTQPLVRTARVEWPLAVAGCALVLYVVGCLAGQAGVAPPRIENDALVQPLLSERMMFAVKGTLRIGLFSLCLVAGAYFLQLLDRRPIGDVRALLVRMALVASVGVLAMFLPIDTIWLKKTYDVVVPLVIVWLAMIPLYRISMRDAGVILLGGIMALMVLAFGSLIVDFAVR